MARALFGRWPKHGGISAVGCSAQDSRCGPSGVVWSFVPLYSAYEATYTTALAYAPSHLTERATHVHPLHPAALASVPYGIVLVRVRVPARWAKSQDRITQRPAMARWNRFAGSIYKLKILWGLVLLSREELGHLRLSSI